MAKDPQFEKQIKDDAGTFLSRIIEVEGIVDALTPASTLDESAALAVTERLDTLDCLRFVAWCVGEDQGELSTSLGKVGIQPDGIERIATFAKKYSIYDLFFRRLHRANQGYKNELTRLSNRPSIQAFSNNIMVTLQLYNHDRLAITINHDFDGLVDLINLLLEAASDTAESIAASAPEILRSALDRADISEVMRRAEALNQFAERVKTKAEQSN